jgi:hypothetical protein
MMLRWFRDLDRILRGEATRPAMMRRRTIEVPVGGLLGVLVVLAMATGLCMGCFALVRADGQALRQLVASIVKVPALFVLTLVVTLPSLYVFNAIVGARLTLPSLARLLTACVAVITAVSASLGPIVAFFSVSTTSYAFMVLLNVAAFAIAGGMGLIFLLQTLQRLSLVHALPQTTEQEELVGVEKHDEAPPGALEPLDDAGLDRRVKRVFRLWMVLFGLVGAQMGWVLRPFIGNPSQPFAWLRPRESNFFEAVWRALLSLFS